MNTDESSEVSDVVESLESVNVESSHSGKTSDESDSDETESSDSDQSDDDSDDFEESDEVEESNEQDDVVTLLIKQFFLKHNLTYVDLLTLITKINKMEHAVVPTSKYLFQKVLPKTAEPIYHHYCKKCMAYIGEKKIIEKYRGRLIK